MKLPHSLKIILLPVLLLLLITGCSIRRTAVNMVGDALASGSSVYETDEDVELVVDALPFGLKFMEGLLAESPNHPGLLLTLCKGFVLYSYANVDYEAVVAEEIDLDRARALKKRARKLYLRALEYGFRSLEHSYPGFEDQLFFEPEKAVERIEGKNKKWDLSFLYYSAAALGSAISISRDDAAMLARLPEVEAMIDRGLELDETWGDGSFHEIKIKLAAAKVGESDQNLIRKHYKRALELSQGRHAGLYLDYAEAVSIVNQDRSEFLFLVEQVLAMDPDKHPEDRLLNLIAQRRALWLLDRIDELFLEGTMISELRGGQP